MIYQLPSLLDSIIIKKIVGDRRFWQSVGITLKYTVAEIPLQMIIGVVLSALLAKNTRKNKIFRSIYFLPVIASAVTVGVTWQLVLHSNIGIFTYWLKLLGFSDINLLNNASSAIFVVVFVAIWKTFWYFNDYSCGSNSEYPRVPI